MNNKNAVRGAIITEFINSKDKNMKFSSVQELIILNIREKKNLKISIQLIE